VVALCRPVLAPRGRGGLSDCWTLSGKATCLITKNAKRRYLQSGEGAFGRAPLSWRGGLPCRKPIRQTTCNFSPGVLIFG
jgi:hypothetical protein